MKRLGVAEGCEALRIFGIQNTVDIKPCARAIRRGRNVDKGSKRKDGVREEDIYASAIGEKKRELTGRGGAKHYVGAKRW